MIYSVFTLAPASNPTDVRYVGITTQSTSKRLQDIVSVALQPYCKGHNSFVSEWIRELHANDDFPVSIAILHTEDKGVALHARSESFAKHVLNGRMLNAHGHKNGTRYAMTSARDTGKTPGRDVNPESKHSIVNARRKKSILS